MKNNISTTKLAKLCGVSQGTVDRALNNRKGISEKTKERILAVAKQYGYRPNIHARSIAGGRSMLIGIVVFDLNNQYFSDILMRIEEYCAKKDYSAVVMFTDKDPKKEIECIKNLYHMAVDGIVLCPTDIYTVRLYEKAESIGAEIIGFDNITFIDELGLKLDSVAYDVKATAESITEYIINGTPISSPVKHWIIKRGSV